MFKYRRLLALGITAMSLFTLTACGHRSANSGKTVKLSEYYSSKKPATKAGDDSTLKVAEINDSPFEGVAAPTLQTNAEDSDVYAPGDEGSLFYNNANHRVIKGGLATLKLNKRNNTATITLRKNARWSNGMKVTAKDIEYPYEIIANPKSKAESYSPDMNDVKGLKAYHDGKANTISGITYPDGQSGRVAQIAFHRLTPAMKYVGNDFIQSCVEPYEYIKNVPIPDLGSSPQVRKHPIFTGPYKLSSQVQGESTSWVPNKYYYGKQPHIKHINIQVVSSNNDLESFKSKDYDFSFEGGISSSQFKRVARLKGYSVVGSPNPGYSDFGFNLGYTKKDGKNVMYKHTKMGNPDLRKAMMYALDLNLVSKKFGNGLNQRGNTLIPPVFHKYHASYASDPGFPYNMHKAKALLRKAGYRKDGGKYLHQPNGKPLVINFGVMQGDSIAAAITQYYMQQWRKLGLNVKLAHGEEMEMNSFYSTLEKPKQNMMDVFEIAFDLGSEPTPTSLYGSTADDNFSHFNTKENSKLLKEMNDEKSFNLKHRIHVFYKWERYMNKEAAYAPEFYNQAWTAVSHRLKNYSESDADNDFWGNLELTSPHI